MVRVRSPTKGPDSDMRLDARDRAGALVAWLHSSDPHSPPGAETRRPTADGSTERIETREIGDWLAVHGEAVFGTDGGDVTEFVTRGRQTTRGHALYLIMRFWDGQPTLRLADLQSAVERVTLLTTGQVLDFEQDGEVLEIRGLPAEAPTRLFAVIKIECDSPPRSGRWGRERLWAGDPTRVADWARTRGTSVWLDGHDR